MIAFVKGKITDLTEENVVVDTGNFGVNVRISTGTAASLPGIGGDIKLYTYTCVREDMFILYGFLTRDDLEVFKKLITVNGIGPKGGLAILSVMNADALRFAVLSGDAAAIAKAPGVGKKTAERVILDLKDKISLEDTTIHKEMVQTQTNLSGDSHARNEAVEALTALGYSPADALKAVKAVPDHEDMDVETILKLALKNMF
ncbi:Holliday junction branch migration protein RuvA [Parablautia muri]|uniref:Holliday junction branch migration complex subunit RuvA n=1 Tax=Parablautia muri TaxID=2320879 RepID=A0A9X5BD83_9FIRM|nr:Holliday junction branch migration protein RuvA [Parablautia muri]NBJ91502.1 Holliday junction branch migration protein RuvA [Parablautia muri]